MSKYRKNRNILYDKLNKKSQSLSINTVIIAILAMIVLVILIFVIVKNVQNLNNTTESCRAKNGVCKEDSCDILTEIEINARDCAENEKCCIPLITKKE